MNKMTGLSDNGSSGPQRFSKGNSPIARAFDGITKDENGRKRFHLKVGKPCSFSERRLRAAMDYAGISVENAREITGACALFPIVRIRPLEPQRPEPVLLSAQAIAFLFDQLEGRGQNLAEKLGLEGCTGAFFSDVSPERK